MSLENLQKNDPEIAASIGRESGRQHQRLELIASENYVSDAVLEAQAASSRINTLRGTRASGIMAVASSWMKSSSWLWIG